MKQTYKKAGGGGGGPDSVRCTFIHTYYMIERYQMYSSRLFIVHSMFDTSLRFRTFLLEERRTKNAVMGWDGLKIGLGDDAH